MSELALQIFDLHGQGVRSVDIAHRLNVAQSTVHYHLRKLTEPPARSESPPESPGPKRSPTLTRALVGRLLAQGLSRAEIARRLGLAKSTVSYHAHKLGAGTDGRFANRFDWADVQAYYDAGHTVRQCAEAFGFSTWSWHQAARRGLVTARPSFRPIDEVFAANTPRNRGHLKQRLLRAGLKDGHCEACGLSQWLGRPLSLALHHVNGDRHDNRLENLQLLCPNCHSQTDTFAGRNSGPA
jgi:DNA-binding CsgD family transcriptional regulator